MRIGDLVSMDAHGDFRSDVQLSDFDNPKLNSELLENHIFTVHAPATYGAMQRNLSARDVLEQLKTVFSVDRSENRIVLTANYGHGKSHLALVLANFFCHPADSRETGIIFRRLEQALGNPSQFAGYREFKKSKGEFLVVRLQGDAFGDLQEGFVRALEQALREHRATRAIEMPFWYRQAETWLNSLNGEMRQKAETFLSTQHTDLPTLLVSLRRPGAYEQVRELVKHVTGMYPDFGREISLDKLVIWAVDEVCVPYKLGGLLILFDEFGLFLQKYMTTRAVGKLQELLNGISNRPGKSAFLAFSQQDVDSLVETYAQGLRREDVKKELERLPKDKRVRLYSLMEAVLASYLKQDRASWQSWFGQPSRKGHLVQAREITLKHFHKRYVDELSWNTEAVHERVVVGCFPLHPLTAAILSVHNFESGAGENPRTALQFVRRTWQELCQQSVELEDGKPNFVFAAMLVDFFGEQISRKWYTAYRTAVETAPQPLTAEQQRILQGLLIQHAVVLKASAGDQVDLLHHLSGLDRDVIKRGLQELAAQKVISSDPVHKVSSLWSAGIRPQEVEDVIQKAVENTPIDHALMDMIVKQLSSPEVSSLNFGHNSDWSPRQIALTDDMLTTKELGRLLQPYRTGINGIEEGPRGLIIWLIAQSEEEKTRLRQTTQPLLDEALSSTVSPLPMVTILPKRTVPGLIASARRLRALENLSASAREKIGTVMYQQEEGLAKESFANSLGDLVGDRRYYTDSPRSLDDLVLPGPYRASVQALKNLTLKTVITECYRQAYAYRVEFYTQYAVAGKGLNQLRNATQKVAIWLFCDTAGKSVPNLGKKDIEHQIATVYLTQKWGLLATDTYAIQRPTARAMQEAWDLLEKRFPSGCRDEFVRTALLGLLNPPYGHDYNTITLLVAAWVGFHQHELHLFVNGKQLSLDGLRSLFDDAKHPQDFLNRICTQSPLSISRARPEEMFAQVNGVLDRIRQGVQFTVAQAQEGLIILEQLQDHPHLPQSKREEIEQLRPRLEKALHRAQEYDSSVSTWQQKLVTSDFYDLMQIRDDPRHLPATLLVSTNQPPLEELEKQWNTNAQTALARLCTTYSSLDSLTDYRTHENQLKRVRKQLEQFPAFAQQVDQALETLDHTRTELEKQEGEKTVVAEILSMTPSAGLTVLYDYRARLAALTDLSPQTTTLRDGKLSQIAGRIQQYEQIAAALPEAVQRSTQLDDLRQQRELLLRNLEQFQGTQHYQSLLDLKARIGHLEIYHEGLRELDLLPRRTPSDLADLEGKLGDMETQCPVWLSPLQRTLLDQKKRSIEATRYRKTEEALTWLAEINQRHERGENPESLLRRMETPPAFLPSENLARLDQLRHLLRQELSENVLLQIEALFEKIPDIHARRRCLERLQALVEAI